MEKQIQTVNFHNQTLITLQKDGVPYVAMKPICENIGLDWEAQRQRINRDEVLSEGAFIIQAPTKGGIQKLLCLPIHYLNGWLFGVDVSRVKAEIKQKLITYKKECYQALFDYWNNGVAVNPRLSSEDTLPLRNAVNMATGILKLDYATIYKMVHQRFGITDNKGSKIKTLTKEQIPQAVEYVHGLILEHGKKSSTLSPELTKLLATSIERNIEHATVLQRVNLYGDDTIYTKIDQIRRHTQQLVQYANAHAKQPIFVNGCLSVGLTRIVYELSALKFMGLVDC